MSVFEGFTVKKDNTEKKERINKVQAKKQKKILTMDEAWKHIGQLKNTDSDKKKLREVFMAFKENKIGREIGSEGKSFTKAEALRLWVMLQQERRQERLDALVAETPDNYELVMDMQGLNEMRQILMDEPMIPVDTETTGLNMYGRDDLVGVSFSAMEADRHWYIPLAHDEGNAPVKTAMKVIENVLSWNRDFVFHNATFDLHQFRTNGIEVRGNVHCTQELAKVLNENEPSFRLKELVPRYLHIESDTYDQLFGKDCRFNTVALKYARYYGCKDTHVTGLLYQFQMKHLKKQPKLYNYYMKVEQPLIRVVFEMEREGFYINMADVEEQRQVGEKIVPELEAKLKAILGNINFNSPQQLLPALQKAVSPKLKGTGKKELKPFKGHPVIELLQEYKVEYKQLNSFVKKIDEFIQPDGKLHGTFRQNGARTGRFSSVEPNLQQQPPRARTMFEVDENSMILGLDFSAQEPRMLAHYSQEPILLENYSKGLDLYASLASEFYGKTYEECYKLPNGDDTKERKTFKVIVLAIMYNMGAGSLGATLGISTKEAQAMLDKFASTFPKVAEFTLNNTAEACRNGYVEMRIDEMDIARKRRLPFFKGEKPNKVYDTYSTNAKIQGTSAIQTKLCMIEGHKLCEELSTDERKFALLATVHDELLYKVPKDITTEERLKFEAIMLHTVKLNNIPSGTDAELGRNWGRMKKVVA